MGLDEVIELSLVIFLVEVNVRSYQNTKRWLDAHRIDPSLNEAVYERYRNRSLRESLIRYLNAPGREIAYLTHPK